MAATEAKQGGPVTIKKYANRRLYNTATSSYVTLEHLCQMVKDNVDFVVYDAKSGEDITRSVLTQIIVEEESKGQNLLPISFLRQLIAFYGDNIQHMLLPRYLDYSMQAFSRNQERIQSYMTETFGGIFPFAPLEEMGKQNIAMLEKAMKMFTNDEEQEGGPDAAGRDAAKAGGDVARSTAATQERQIERLQQKLDELQRQVAEMSSKSKD